MKNNVLKFSKEELQDSRQLIFEAKVPVKFRIRSIRQTLPKKDKKGCIIMECIVLSGEHEGQTHTQFLKTDMKNIWDKKRVISFLKAFFPQEDIQEGTINLSDAIDHILIMEFSTPVEKNGKTYQNPYKFEDQGEADEDDDSEEQEEADAHEEEEETEEDETEEEEEVEDEKPTKKTKTKKTNKKASEIDEEDCPF